MFRLAFGLWCFAGGISIATTPSPGQSTMPDNSLSVPKNVGATMDRLLALADTELSYPPHLSWTKFMDASEKANAEFLDLLEVLNQQVNDDLARRIVASPNAGIQRNLMVIASDYRSHPERCRELLKSYGTPASRQARAPRPKRLALQHAVEQYRPAWELLLLAPVTRESRFMRRRCFEAIGKIQDNASIPLLVYLYGRANSGVKEGLRPGDALKEQFLVLATLNWYCNTASLRAMLQCVAISEAVPPPLPKLGQFTMKELFVRYLQDKENYGNGEQWKQVINEALKQKEGLSEAERTFLEGVLKNLAEQ